MKLHSKTSIPSVVAYVSCSLAIFSLCYGFHWPQSISNRLSKFLYCLDNEQWHLTFTYLLFLIHFLTDSLSFSPSHLNIIFSFFYSFFIIIYSSYIYSQQLYFSMKSVISITFFAILYKNDIKILCEKLLLVLIWTHHWNYFFTHQY